MRSIIIVLSLLIMSVSGSLAEESKLKPEISEFKLDNGLRLVVIPDRRAPVVTHMIWYQAGAADDPVGKSGVAHYLEHLMFKGTTKYQNNEFSTAIAEIGGQENAFTSSDYTAYYQKVAPSALKQMMAFEADRMRNVLITEEVAVPELKVILEERSSRVDSSPSSIMNEFVRTALYVHHPYGVPVIGWEHEIANLTRQDTLDFYEKWYQPWNAIVVVAGDVEAEAVLQDAKDTYGKVVASQPEIERNWVKDPKVVVSKTIEYTDKRVTNPSWSRSFITPSYRNAEDGEAEALDLLAAILGGSVKSRIHQEITLNRQIANSAGAWYSGSSRGPGSFGVYGSPRGDVEISEIENALQQEIDKLLTDGVTQEELDYARRAFLKSIIYSQDSQVALARIFGSILTNGGTIEDFVGWPDAIAKVTVEDINKVARKYLDKKRSVTSRLLPEQS